MSSPKYAILSGTLDPSSESKTESDSTGTIDPNSDHEPESESVARSVLTVTHNRQVLLQVIVPQHSQMIVIYAG